MRIFLKGRNCMLRSIRQLIARGPQIILSMILFIYLYFCYKWEIYKPWTTINIELDFSEMFTVNNITIIFLIISVSVLFAIVTLHEFIGNCLIFRVIFLLLCTITIIYVLKRLNYSLRLTDWKLYWSKHKFKIEEDYIQRETMNIINEQCFKTRFGRVAGIIVNY